MLYDRAAKKARGYVEPGSIVRQDGSEKLVGKDWKKRVNQLQFRCGGRCERLDVLGTPHHEFCRGYGEEPHHVIPRSKGRDDKLGNLAWLSHWCHAAEDPRKIGGRKQRSSQ